jgi:hypothetical protein
MTDTTADIFATAPASSATQVAYGLVDGATLGTLAQRSDLRGAARFGIHLTCVAATGTMVWLALPVWYLLIPAMALHTGYPW